MNKPRPLPIRLDFKTRMPAYLQVFNQVQGLAAAGRLSPGDQLPTVRSLARQLGLNFNTTARAYRALRAAGTVSTQPGRGTFLLEDWSPRLAARSKPRLLDALTAVFIAEARREGFSEAEIVAAVRKRLGSRHRG